LCGKQLTTKPSPGSASRLCNFSRWQYPMWRPALWPSRQIGLLQSGKERCDLRKGIPMIEIFDSRRECGRIGKHVVFEIDREVDEAARHGLVSECNGTPNRCRGGTRAARRTIPGAVGGGILTG
jgi:hypothetical protein